MKETFGLLVPCFNAAKFIPAFISNISNQAKQFDEVIFYDDASTDNTVEILESYNQRVIKGATNSGPSTARNKLAEVTTTTWFHFHDIDDFLDDNYLKRVSAFIDDCDVVLCNVDWYDSSRKNILLSWKYSNNQISKDPLSYTLSNPIGGINGLYKKLFFQLLGGFNENVRLWEDADLHVRLAASNARFIVIEEVLSISIRSLTSLSCDQIKACQTRYALLRGYYYNPSFKEVHKTIGREAQKIASALIMYNDIRTAKLALKLSERCGVKVPDSKNFFWSVFKLALPASLRIFIRLIQLRLAFKSHLQA